MNNNAIEELACSAVKELLFEIPRVQPFINSNDKGPSWDGNIYISESDNGSKKNLSKIPVQIKGHMKEAREKLCISHQIDVVDLENYYHSYGCLFFVVYISPSDNAKKTVFYQSLLPYDLRMLLQNKGKKKSLSVKFKQFPKDKTKRWNILLNFTLNASLQSSLHLISNEDFAKAQDLHTGNATVSFSYYYTGKNINEILFDTPAYEYRNLDFGAKIPINKHDSISSVEQEILHPVSCSGKVFYNSYRRCMRHNVLELKIGAGISIIRDDQKKCQTFNYTRKGTLDQQITDMDFVLTAIQAGSIDFNAEKTQMRLNTSSSPKNIQGEMKTLNALKTLQTAFVRAGHKGKVDTTVFTDEDWAKCDILISVFINKKSEFHKKENGIGFFVFTIGNVSLLLLIIQNDKEKQVLNPYTSSIQAGIQGTDGTIPISAFCLLNEENLRKVSKFDFDAVMKDIQTIPYSEEFHGSLVQLLLKMLRAADSNSSDPDMLLYSERLAQWLVEQDKDSIVNKINLYQIFKRKRELSPEEISLMHKLLESPNISNEHKAGIYILLSDWENFSEHFGKLSCEQQKIFIDYPIFYLLPRQVRNQWLIE